MASAGGEVDDISKCPVCFEQFKQPRYLPCLHSFCHDCLNKHILSTTKDQETLIGFNCPVCRTFFPACCPLEHPEKWIQYIPENRVIVSMMEKQIFLKSSNKLCDLCENEGNECAAEHYCKQCVLSLCETCTKYHQKFPVNNDHELVNLEVMTTCPTPDTKPGLCLEHMDEKINLFCQDHETPCCAKCLIFQHKKCENVLAIEKAIESTESEHIDRLIREIDTYAGKVDVNILLQEENNKYIDEKTAVISDKITKSVEDAIRHLKKLEDAKLNEVSKMSKDSKLKIQKSLEVMKNLKAFAEFCRERLTQVKGSNSKLQSFLEYQNIKKMFYVTREVKVIRTNVKITSEICHQLQSIQEIDDLCDVVATDEISFPALNSNYSRLTLVKKSHIPNAKILDSALLPDGKIVLTDHYNPRCLIWDLKNFAVSEVKLCANPWSVYVDSKLYVTISGKGKIQEMTLEGTDCEEVVCNLNSFHGLTKIKDDFIVACSDGVIRLDKDGKILHKYDTDNGVKSVYLNTQDNIIYSSSKQNTVTCVRENGDVIFTYMHDSLKLPYGMAVDSSDKIYITGFHSNNIHVISPEGKLLRIFENIKNPVCITLIENQSKCVVGTHSDNVFLYEFQN